jgi:uncharacterized membrane protein
LREGFYSLEDHYESRYGYYIHQETLGMIHMQGEVVIKQPIETVFDFVADARDEPRYNPHILRAEKISAGPIGLGTRFRNETKSMGRTTEWIIEITSYERPRRLETSLHSSAMDIYGAMTFDSVESGTRMRWSWDIKPRGIFKLATPFIRRMGQSLEERNWENLKSFLEAQ